MNVTKKFITNRSRNVERIDCHANVRRVADPEKIGALQLDFYPKNGDEDWLEVRMTLDDAFEVLGDLFKQVAIERRNERKVGA